MVMLKTIVLDIHIDFAIVSGSRSYPLKTTALFLALFNPNQAGGGAYLLTRTCALCFFMKPILLLLCSMSKSVLVYSFF